MKKRYLYLAVSAIAVSTIITCSVAGHDTWLVPEQFRVHPGDTIAVDMNTGMDFPISLGPVTTDRIQYFDRHSPSEVTAITEYEMSGNSLRAQVKFENSGTHTVAAATRPRLISLSAKEFNEYLIVDGLKSIYEFREEKGLLEEDAVELYSKYPKALVQAGDILTDNVTKPLGLTVELVPLVNPYALEVGDELPVMFLFRGVPVAGVEVSWSYPGKGETFAGTVATDGEGKAVIPLENAGSYVIRAIQMLPVEEKAHSWESYWASLTFETSQ
jgi:uncharacterized GH25 family protein